MPQVRSIAFVAVVFLALSCVAEGTRGLNAVPVTGDAPVSIFAAEFERRSGFDLEGSSIKFSSSGLRPCLNHKGGAGVFPVDPRGGAALEFQNGNLAEEIRFTDGFVFPFLGTSYTNAFISRAGFLSFDVPRDYERTGSLTCHWANARISALFADLSLSASSVISWRQTADAVVVTWEAVGDSDFQVELRADGSITFTYLRVGYEGHKVVGLSAGVEGIVTDLSSSDTCGVGLETSAAAPSVTSTGYGKVFQNGYDLEHSQILFTAPDYQPCVSRNVDKFPVDSLGGEIIMFKHSWDSAAEVRFRNGFRFPFNGVEYASAYVNYNGFITFDGPDTDVSPTMRSHFTRPRISALYASASLDAAKSVVSWQQLADRVVVTFQRVGGSDFQVTLRWDGRISITYLDIEDKRRDMVVGVSAGSLGWIDSAAPAVCPDLGDDAGQEDAAHAIRGVSQAFVDGFDLEHTMVTFTAPDYTPCVSFGVEEFPVSPAGGTVLPFRYSYDPVQEVRFSRGFRFPFGGRFYNSAYLNYNGFLTFDEPDEDVFPSLRSHFQRPRISILYSDLRLSNEETLISWKQFPDRVTFTFSGLSDSSFQLSLLSSGAVSMTFLAVSDTKSTKIVGISTGVTGALAHLSTSGLCGADSWQQGWDDTSVASSTHTGGSAEIFLHGFDIEHATLTFSAPDYANPCSIWDVQDFPVDPRGGEVMSFRYSWNEYQHIRFAGGFRFPFAGRSHSSAYISRRGFITFDSEDTNYSPSLRSHFLLPRISALYSDLLISDTDSVISWKQVGTERVTITFQGVSDSNYQVSLLADGTVAITYLSITKDANVKVVGVSLGSAGKILDLSNTGNCPVAAMSASSVEVPELPSGMAQAFAAQDVDLEHTTLTFSGIEHSVCASYGIDALPVNPAGGVFIELDRYDESPTQVNFRNGFKFPFMGRTYSSVYLSRKGFIAFTGDDTPVFPSLRSHFAHPRISALYADLSPSRDELDTALSWKQLANSVAVTWSGVGDSDFQAILHEDGTIQLSYLQVGVTSTSVVGVSRGVVGDFSDFSNVPSCEFRSKTVSMVCPEGSAMTSSQTTDGGLLIKCSDGSSLTCEVDNNSAACTVRSKNI